MAQFGKLKSGEKDGRVGGVKGINSSIGEREFIKGEVSGEQNVRNIIAQFENLGNERKGGRYGGAAGGNGGNCTILGSGIIKGGGGGGGIKNIKKNEAQLDTIRYGDDIVRGGSGAGGNVGNVTILGSRSINGSGGVGGGSSGMKKNKKKPAQFETSRYVDDRDRYGGSLLNVRSTVLERVGSAGNEGGDKCPLCGNSAINIREKLESFLEFPVATNIKCVIDGAIDGICSNYIINGIIKCGSGGGRVDGSRCKVIGSTIIKCVGFGEGLDEVNCVLLENGIIKYSGSGTGNNNNSDRDTDSDDSVISSISWQSSYSYE